MNNGCSEDMLQQYMENTTILKSITYNNNIYPNGGGVDCTCTFFRDFQKIKNDFFSVLFKLNNGLLSWTDKT